MSAQPFGSENPPLEGSSEPGAGDASLAFPSLAGREPTRSEPRFDLGDRSNLLTLVGAVAACVIGAIVGIGLPGGSGAPTSSAAADAAPVDATALHFQPIAGPYSPPDRASIVSGYDDGARIFASQGLSGVARASMGCFQRLAGAGSYLLMDYCLALDAYGDRAYRSAVGDAGVASTYFGQSPVRRLRAMQDLTAGQTDASSRMLDTSRLIEEAAQQHGGRPVATIAAVAPPAPPAPVVAAPPAERLMVLGPPRLDRPAPAPVVAPRAAPPTDRLTALGPLRPDRPVPAPYLDIPPLAEAAPPRPASREPAPFAGPSFNCRYARSTTERMVCGEPDLAAADRRLARVFDRAMAETPQPRALRREQDAWLAHRDRMGGDYGAVLDAYQQRIDELRDLEP